MIEDAHESRYETNVDYSFFTEPVSCEVHNKVGSTNVSTLVNVHCEWLHGRGRRRGQGPLKGRGWGQGRSTKLEEAWEEKWGGRGAEGRADFPEQSSP